VMPEFIRWMNCCLHC